MADRTLSVTADELRAVGNEMINISGIVDSIYEKVEKTVREVTANDSWKSEASETFLTKYEEIKVQFDKDLESLRELGPAIIEAADGYSSAEAENVANMNAIERG